ncbi:MAG: hypothetical protein JJ934_14140 [Pseudomonadales bacterium]|nr:hypothetical protein [Pseudomonadales bacterium]MBO6597677.1 hypothetical protein [Pseudomonadales bacterium]MBO6658034.1 hypothetical protein [Pseudomonadales bacterium]MBO6703992.1 hypothetical protein [Pseudomonadales bacterium]
MKHHEPYPCLGVVRSWNLLMKHEAKLKLFAQFIDPTTVWAKIDDPGEQNLVRLVMHPDGLKPDISNWSGFVSDFVRGLKQELRATPWTS